MHRWPVNEFPRNEKNAHPFPILWHLKSGVCSTLLGNCLSVPGHLPDNTWPRSWVCLVSKCEPKLAVLDSPSAPNFAWEVDLRHILEEVWKQPCLGQNKKVGCIIFEPHVEINRDKAVHGKCWSRTSSKVDSMNVFYTRAETLWTAAKINKCVFFFLLLLVH